MQTKIIQGILILSCYSIAWAQPANDDCANAYQLEFANSEAEAILVAGDTRGAIASTTPTAVCSQTFFTDDVWYKFTTPIDLPTNGVVIKAYFNNTVNPTDLPHVGMAVYASCDLDEVLVSCYVDDNPDLNKTELPSACLNTGQEYLVRIWSGGADATTEGTFQIGVFANTTSETSLWWETFAGGLEANGWTTEGVCAIADSNHNAGWKYLPTGLVDGGQFIFAGAAINSPTLCDGAVGVDSDFNDSGGINSFPPSGLCPTPGHHELLSPVIYSGSWNVAGLSLTWTQAIRQFQSTHFFAYRIRDVDSEWSDWMEREINTEYVVNGDFLNNEIQRFPLPGAVGHDSLQLRFTYNDNYYMWAIDDVMIISQECSNSKISQFYAIPPFAQIPSHQIYAFPALADIFNIGACPITNSVLHCTVIEESTMDTIYFDSLTFGTIESDSLPERRILPSLIELPDQLDDYRMIYSLTHDSTDFTPDDNEISIPFSTGGDVFALEDGFTRSVAIANSVYDKGAPLSYAYGNYFTPSRTTCAERIVWGVNNAADMAGKTLLVLLLEWSDLNQNQIAESNERKFIGYNDFTFIGDEGENAILETTLDNFESPGLPVVMEAGHGYMAIIEYQATSEDDPQLFLLASEERDYTGQQIASDSAFAQGLITKPSYFSVLGFSPDGDISHIDYEVKELDPLDDRIFFGNDIVPLVRVVTYVKGCLDRIEELSSAEKISVFPNPVNESLTVTLGFTKQHHGVKINLVNSLGQLILTRSLNSSILSHTEKFDVKDLVAGSYHLQVETAEGQRTIPVVIIH